MDLTRRKMLGLLAAAPLLPYAAKLAPIDPFGNGFPVTLSVAQHQFIDGMSVYLDGFALGAGPRGAFRVTHVDTGVITVEAVPE
jgi:hypothetical protein